MAAGEIDSDDVVLEVGPGRGALTRRLIERGAQVVAVELDSHLASSLSDRLGSPPNLTVVQADARTLEIAPLLGPDVAYKVVGSLPYYAANPIIRRFLENNPRPSLLVVMVQEEVARNMVAAPGRMGLLSVATQYYAVPKLVCTVPPRAFRPQPKVTSAVVRLEPRDRPPVDVADADIFFELLRAGFSSPRKQLRNSLAHGLGVPAVPVGEILANIGIDGSRRPATLSLEEWAIINGAWEQLGQLGSAGIR